jgi:dihydroorotate dehydrogenase electron transfer subunit
LRRPISVADVAGDRLRLVFRVVGRGTEMMSRLKRGDVLDVLGPLGKPAPLPRRRDVVVVGGGIGIAPLLFLGRRLSGRRLQVFLGAKTKEQLVLRREFRSLGVEPVFVSDDGSIGRRGFVSESAADAIRRAKRPVVYACGPQPMLADLVRRVEPVPVWGFIEERMGCGTGICYCCALPKRGGGFVRFCEEGPVVLLNEAVL